MNKFLKRFLNINSIFLLNTLIILDFIPEEKNSLYAYDRNDLKLEKINNKSKSFYILGPGDKLFINISELTSSLDSTVSVDGEGNIQLKRINKINVEGLTIEELRKTLNKKYSDFIIDPDVKISILNYRPINIFIKGEVENPGYHQLLYYNNFENNNSSGLEEKLIIFPSLVDALRKAGGITNNADLTNIQVTRINSISEGGGRISTSLDLVKTIELNDNSQNIRLMDGDILTIYKSKNDSLLQISKAIQSNLSPKYINIILGGRVENGGSFKFAKNTSLNQAIQFAGLKVFRGKIQFTRNNNDGSLDKRKFSYDTSAPVGSYKNPYLKNGDIVFVGKSLLNVSTEIISEITSPFSQLVSGYGMYKIISD